MKERKREDREDTMEFRTEQEPGCFDLREQRPDPEAVERLSEATARKYGVIPVKLEKGAERGERDCLWVAMADPEDLETLNDLAVLTGCRILPLFCREDQIALQLDRSFGCQSVLEEPVVSIAQSILEQAVRRRASDIHFEPQKGGMRIRLRIDGQLKEEMRCEHALASLLTARLKIFCGMDISEKRRPQDGRASLLVDHREYDIRASCIPTVHGEKIVLRLIGQEGLVRKKTELGMDEEALRRFDEMFSSSRGLVLVTGPTGSGKTTTLYAALEEMKRNEINILTVEDPVEVTMEGISQMQVNPKIGLNFASALRYMLRQDPDVLMVGEIRDRETAKLAVEASLTGHLVVSTLHTGSTSSSILRLLNMGIEPYLLSDALRGVVSQRLVRRLCRCKRPREMTESEGRELKPFSDQAGIVWEPVGCERCFGTGYEGRCGVFELMPMSPTLRIAAMKQPSSSQLRRLAVNEGMKTLRCSAARLVCSGVTSMEEYYKIACEEELE